MSVVKDGKKMQTDFSLFHNIFLFKEDILAIIFYSFNKHFEPEMYLVTDLGTTQILMAQTFATILIPRPLSEYSQFS